MYILMNGLNLSWFVLLFHDATLIKAEHPTQPNPTEIIYVLASLYECINIIILSINVTFFSFKPEQHWRA